MRNIRLTPFITLTALLLLIVGCGADTGSDSAFNPATSASETFESFTVEDKDQGGMPFVSRTIFFDFYRGLEAAEGKDDRGTAAQLRERLNLLMGLTPSEDGKRYVAARNPFDLLHHVINTDQIGTFNDGKRLMRDSVTSGDPATYNTPAKNAIIRFTDLEGNTGEDPGSDQVWVYPLLDWTSSFSQFEPVTASIFRSAQFIARPPADEESEPSEIQSAFWGGQFNGDKFSATGYNQPEFVALSITGRQLGEVEFYQVYLGSQYDTLILRDTQGITIDGEEPAYICALMSYASNEVKVVYVVDPDADTGDAGSGRNVQCPDPDAGNSFIYESEPVQARQ
jgi:hypothetical protein